MKPPNEIQDGVTRMVRALLGANGRLQSDLAEVLGVHKTGVSTRMNKGGWTIEDLDAMAQFFEVPVATFFEDPRDLIKQGKWISPCIDGTAELADVTVR